MIVAILLAASGASALSIDDLHSAYGDIFASGNRNAASHLWASWILARSTSLTHTDFSGLFSGFCPVSGSPVRPTGFNTYQYTLKSVGSSARAAGLVNHCCAPCVCDTLDMISADSKTVELADGAAALTFAVIGDPCQNPEELSKPFVDPFTGTRTTLAATAPEVRCEGGKLVGATYSDHGGVIVGLLRDAPAVGPPPVDPSPGRVVVSDGVTFSDSREYSSYCAERAAGGFASGMGLIFREVAKITSVHAAASKTAAIPDDSAVAPALDHGSPASKCDHLLPPRRQRVDALVRAEAVLILGMRHTRCLMAAAERLEGMGACYTLESWDEPNDPLWAYLQCKHPHEIVNGMQMHS